MDFSLTLENAPSVAKICGRFDGIPLAIELAAARVSTFSTEQIARQLDESFNILSGGSRTALPRHQTLRASINWSWDLLTESEQILMRQLSVFAGGWTIAAAQSVCVGDILELTTSLVKKSLIEVHKETRRERRYRFHETIREFAREKLVEAGELEVIRSEHLKYFLALSKEIGLGLCGHQRVEWLARGRDERDNMRAALEEVAKSDLATGLYIWTSLVDLWQAIDVYEGVRWMAEFVQKLDSKDYPREHYLWARVRLGYFALRAGHLAEAHSSFAEAAQEFLKDKNEIGVVFALEGVAGFFATIGKPKGSARLVGTADITRERISDPRPPIEQADVDKVVAACIAEIGEAAFSDAYEAGREMSLGEAVTYALES